MAKKAGTSAPNLLANSKSYLDLALQAVQTGSLQTGAEPAFYLLVCFSIELSLKAICLHAELAQNTVKNFGHDLQEAYSAAAAVGGVPRVMSDIGRIVLQLRAYHLQNTFRYTPDVPSLTIPQAAACLSTVQGLLRIAEKFCARPINRSWSPP
jgi:hypothetical protein